MKYIFITGGVVSGLGKGICAASLGRLLKQRGLRVQNQKFDPYLNVDPGTMSPYQHGEVFVTDDGAETDLDLGHYERFTDESLTAGCSVSAGFSGSAGLDSSLVPPQATRDRDMTNARINARNFFIGIYLPSKRYSPAVPEE